MKYIIIMIMVMAIMFGCGSDDSEREYTYKTTVMESPCGRLKVTFQYDTEDEIEYLNLYWDAIVEFQDRVFDDYENFINDQPEE